MALLQQAYRVSRSSHDTSTWVGALLRTHIWDGEGEPLLEMQASNQFVDPTMRHDPKYSERPLKYKITEHAERAVIYRAAHYGIGVKGCTLVCPWACCSECARAIVLAGVSEVIAHKDALDKTPERWREDLILGHEILKRGGVKLTLCKGKLFVSEEFLFDGEMWTP